MLKYIILLRKEVAKYGSKRLTASKMGIPPASITNYIDFNMVPKMPTLKKLSDYFHIPVSQLMQESDESTETTIYTPPPGYQDTSTLRDIIDIHKKIHEIESEIGRIKDRLLDAAVSGDIKKLTLITGGKK